jgi:hypothetical protein
VCHGGLTPNGDAEAKRFADASAGTDLNLSTAEIAAFRALPERTNAAVEAELRKVLLARYQVYRASGLAGSSPTTAAAASRPIRPTT